MGDRYIISPKEYLMMFFFLAVSGGEFFCMAYGRYFIPLFFLLAFWFHTNKYHRIRLFKGARYIFIGLSYMIIHYYLIYPNHVKNTFLPSVIMLFGAYLYLSCYSMPRFKRLYLNTVYVMAFVSIIIWGLVMINVLSPALQSYEDSGIYMFLFHNMGAGRISSRLSGIYWEPGAYQVILNMTFLFYIDDFVNKQIDRSDWKKFGVILVAVLLTISTVAYLFLALLVAYWSFIKLKGKFTLTRLFAVGILSVVAVIGIYNSTAVQGKLQEREQGYESSSYTIRANDNLALLMMISEKPILGWGRDSQEYVKVGEQLGSISFSNGILSMIACLGFPFFFIWLFFLYGGVKRLYPYRNAIILTLFIIFQNSFEDFWWLPVTYSFFFLNADIPVARSMKNVVVVKDN